MARKPKALSMQPERPRAKNVSVLARIIVVDNEAMIPAIVAGNNTQNSIVAWDRRSNDPVQIRIKQEFESRVKWNAIIQFHNALNDLVLSGNRACLSCYNPHMSKIVLDQRSSVALPPEALDALGVEAGAELELEIVGRALVVRSLEEARRSRKFMNAFDSVLARRRTAYEELAKGPGE